MAAAQVSKVVRCWIVPPAACRRPQHPAPMPNPASHPLCQKHHHMWESVLGHASPSFGSCHNAPTLLSTAGSCAPPVHFRSHSAYMVARSNTVRRMRGSLQPNALHAPPYAARTANMEPPLSPTRRPQNYTHSAHPSVPYSTRAICVAAAITPSMQALMAGRQPYEPRVSQMITNETTFAPETPPANASKRLHCVTTATSTCKMSPVPDAMQSLSSDIKEIYVVESGQRKRIPI